MSKTPPARQQRRYQQPAAVTPKHPISDISDNDNGETNHNFNEKGCCTPAEQEQQIRFLSGLNVTPPRPITTRKNIDDGAGGEQQSTEEHSRFLLLGDLLLFQKKRAGTRGGSSGDNSRGLPAGKKAASPFRKLFKVGSRGDSNNNNNNTGSNDDDENEEEEGQNRRNGAPPTTTPRIASESSSLLSSSEAEAAYGVAAPTDRAVYGGSDNNDNTISRSLEDVSELSGGFNHNNSNNTDSLLGGHNKRKISNHIRFTDDNTDPPKRSDETSWSATTTKTFVVGPVLDFLTADATLFMFLCFFVALYPTTQNWRTIFVDYGPVPLSVVLSWVLLAFAAGQAFSTNCWRASRVIVPTTASVMGGGGGGDVPIAEIKIHKRDDRVQEEVFQQQKRQRHSILMRAFKSSPTKLKFQAAKVKVAVLDQGVKVWTNLNPVLRGSKNRLSWERTVDPTRDPAKEGKDNVLMGRLLKNPVYKRVRRVVATSRGKSVRIAPDSLYPAEPASIMDANGGGDVTEGGGMKGKFDTAGVDTAEEDLLDLVVKPQMKLRGMDVLMCDGDPESDVCTHPWLLKNGLRNVPTLVINVLTPWANLLIYLEMPEWVDRVRGFEENPEDDEETIALKRFLNDDDDDYRNQRLKMIPVVAEGPLAVRLLAPPKKELVISCANLPVTWRMHEASTDSRGKRLCPVVEMELDCVSSRAIRGMAGILKRNLSSLCIDVAFAISSPLDQEEEKEEDEPQACLGLFRFDHIDLEQCSKFPDRFACYEETDSARSVKLDPDVSRASKIMNVDVEELQRIADEED